MTTRYPQTMSAPTTSAAAAPATTQTPKPNAPAQLPAIPPPSFALPEKRDSGDKR